MPGLLHKIPPKRPDEAEGIYVSHTQVGPPGNYSVG